MIAASVLLAIFGSLVVVSQLLAYTNKSPGLGSISGAYYRGIWLAHFTNIMERDDASGGLTGGSDRRFDRILPTNACVFLTGLTGSTNGSKAGYYYFLTYYLFPREVAVTLDEPHFTANDGIRGYSPDSDAEIGAKGFNVRVDLAPDSTLRIRTLLPLAAEPANPKWFGSPVDTLVAILLPLLTALAGIWLLRFMSGPGLTGRMPMTEQLACGLGLGMMAVAALTLGVKLCGGHGRGWVLALTTAGSVAELWRDRKAMAGGICSGFRNLVSNPIAVLIYLAGAAVLLIYFRLAGLAGIVEFDAVADWLFKAKIFFLCTGHEIAGWFSNPRLAYAHLDYPTLVPSLYAATYDSIGHVDEFVTKFWPTWMLLFLLMALASLSRSSKGWFPAPLFFLLGVLLLPFTQTYVQMEGGTLPMVFFTVLGFVQCAIGLSETDRVRLGLGLTLLFGAAMTKFEGMIFLILTVGWILLLPGTRALLRPTPRVWRTLGFCFLAALPFICLRAQIPALHYESHWARYAMYHPGITLTSAPKLFLIMLARLFLNPDFANWTAPDGQLHWTGHWNGFSSLFNPMAPGLAWVCLLITVLLWMAMPARRTLIIWTQAVFWSSLGAFSIVFASFVSVSGLDHVIMERTADNTSERYLFPMLLAWGATMVILSFGDMPPANAIPNDQTASGNDSASSEPATGNQTNPHESPEGGSSEVVGRAL